jgi:hypothetical protein
LTFEAVAMFHAYILVWLILKTVSMFDVVIRQLAVVRSEIGVQIEYALRVYPLTS